MMKCSSGLLVKRHTLSAIVGPLRVRGVALNEVAQHRLVTRVALAVDAVGVGLLLKVVVPPELEARHVELGNP